jgi:hypothetical protein
VRYLPSWKYGALPPTPRSEGVSNEAVTSPCAQLRTLCFSPSGSSPASPWQLEHAAWSDSKMAFPRDATAASTFAAFGACIDCT